ncbi:hypothetical protein KCU85_g9077, partial [Aureobasidium melanogenum]
GLDAGAGVNGSGDAGLKAGAGLGGSAGLDAGAGVNGSGEAGLEAGAGLGGSAGLGAGAGVGGSGSAGLDAGIGGSAGLKAGAGVGGSGSAGLDAGAGVGGSAGLGASGSLSGAAGGSLDVSLGLNATVNVWGTFDILADHVHGYTAAINATCNGISGKATDAQIAEVKENIQVLIGLIGQAKAHLSVAGGIGGHSNAELAALISELLLEIEFTVKFAVKVCGFSALKVVVFSLATACHGLITVACSVVTGLKVELAAHLRGVVGLGAYVLGSIVSFIL